jgi:hypothetical protein
LRALAARPAGERGRERGLADTRLAGDEHEAATTAVRGISQGLPERGQLGVPADKARPAGQPAAVPAIHRSPSRRPDRLARG